MNTLAKNFLHGCLVLVPATVTIYVVYVVFRKVDGLLGLGVPGLGFVLTLVLITAAGALARNVIGKRLIALPDRILGRLPLVKLVYTSLRDLMAALLGERRSFDRPVLVALDAEGAVKALGFITRDDLGQLGLDGYVAVYFPQSINFAGQLALLPRARVQELQVPPSELLPFIVSGGMAGA